MAPDRLPRPPADSDTLRRANGRSPPPLKIFVAVLAVGLSLSTLLGLMIALNSRATSIIGLVVLAAGTSMPLVLLFL